MSNDGRKIIKIVLHLLIFVIKNKYILLINNNQIHGNKKQIHISKKIKIQNEKVNNFLLEKKI